MTPATPSPAEQKCPNCGTMAPLDFALCPRCGMTLSAPSKTIYGCATLLFQVVLAVLALTFGASGACFTLFGMFDGVRVSGLLITGVLLLGLAYLCVRAIFQIRKPRQ